MSPASWKQPVSIPGVFKATDPGYIANVRAHRHELQEPSISV